MTKFEPRVCTGCPSLADRCRSAARLGRLADQRAPAPLAAVAQVGAHRRAGGVGVAGGDGVEDALVLGVDPAQERLALRPQIYKPRQSKPVYDVLWGTSILRWGTQ